MKKLIILFDLDGTLIDSTPAIYQSFCAAMRANNYSEPSLESVKRTIGKTLQDMFLAHNVPQPLLEKCVENYRTHYRAQMEAGTTLLPRAYDAVVLAHSFAFLGVVTTKRGDFSQKLLQSFGILHYFNCIIGIENTTQPKPAAEPILNAIAQIAHPEIPHDSIFMIGDTTLDLQAATNAGVKALGLLCGYGAKKDLESFDVPLFADAFAAVESLKSYR